ncbi:MAG: NlpC/P60 family protein [Rhodobacteraceae bacterium]|nr:NlpC/P60 family protein [Paracoccaceae bacterium]
MDKIVMAARGWIGTPYQHQASCKGAGADCLGLLRGVWREVIGAEPEPIPAYTPDWSETDKIERLQAAAARWLTPVEQAVAGDVLLFRMRSGAVAKHLAIVADAGVTAPKIIHAYSGRGVVLSPLTPAWQRRIAGKYRFPDRRN